MAAVTVRVTVRKLGWTYRLEPWRCAMPKVGETVRVGFNDVSGLVVGFSMKGREWRTHFPLEED